MAVDYPMSLPRPSYENHSITPPQPYYATEFDVGAKLRPTALGNVNLVFSFNFTQEQLAIFTNWFYGTGVDQLNGGTKLFTANWLIWGIESTFELAFADKGSPKFTPIPNSTRWRANLTLRLVTDIYELIGLNSLEGLCPEPIECVYDYIIWSKTA